MAAPAENMAADVSAACTGRAVVISDMPSSSRAWAAKASFAMSCWATCRASPRFDATLDVDFGKLIELSLGAFLNSLRSRARSACSVSDCELTDTYSPAAIDMAPATSPATPAIKTSLCFADGAATPTIKLAVEMMPSLAPSTAALIHPMRPRRWCSECSRRRLMRPSQIRPSTTSTRTTIKMRPIRPTPP